MSDLWKIVLTSALTVAGGVLVLMVGQLFQRFFIEPLHEQAKVLGEIAYALTYYAPIYANPSPTRVVKRADGVNLTDATEDALRALASHLIATTTAIRWYGLARCVFSPPRKDVLEGAVTLIGLSNGVRTGTAGGNMETRDLVLKLLRINWRVSGTEQKRDDR